MFQFCKYSVEIQKITITSFLKSKSQSTFLYINLFIISIYHIFCDNLYICITNNTQYFYEKLPINQL